MKQTGLVILLLFIANVVYGQDTLKSTSASSSYEDAIIPKLVPVSPNAASLGIFGAIPVGHYTGVPNISVPIYEIDLDGKKFPIQISYHASGIKVGQEASSVGLGWALNAGGCITKEVRGWDDFRQGPVGYYFDQAFPIPDANNDPNPSTAWDDIWKFEMYTKNQSDPEPDLFHFNFGSFSGSLFFNKRIWDSRNTFTTAKAIVQKETAYLDVTYYVSANSYDGSWIISDGDGFKYYFNTHEISEMFSRDESSYLATPMPRTYFHSRPVQSIVATTWYLDSIVSPLKNKIIFSYEKEKIYSPISVSEDASHKLHSIVTIINGEGPYGNGLAGTYLYYNYSFTKTEQARLVGISFNGGNLTFNYSDRLDIESVYPYESAKKLNSIVINNKQETIKNITLKQSYLGNTSNPLTCRLMLDTLKIGLNENVQNYVFLYNRNDLPSKQSPSFDYWGYYSFPIFSLVPKLDFYLSPPVRIEVEGEIKLFQGRSRSSMENYIQNGILTAIQYPTGGKTLFEYEVHDFQNYFFEYSNKQVFTSIYYDTQEAPKYVSEDFDFPEITELYLDLSSYLCNPGLTGTTEEVTIYIEKKQNNNTYSPVELYHLFMDIPDSRSYIKMLAIGTYRIRMAEITNNSNTCINVLASTVNRNVINKGGGLRIKSITDYTSSDNYIKRNFTYRQNGESSGLLMTTPLHHVYFVIDGEYRGFLHDFFWGDRGIDYAFAVLYLNGFSSSYTPFGNSAMGGTVGYSYVEEKITDSNSNGYIAYTFVNRQDSLVDTSDRSLKSYPAIPNLNNGSPLEISYYDKDMNLQKKEEFAYLKKKSASIKGIKLYSFPMTDITVHIKFYDLYSEWWALDKKISSLFVNNQNVASKTEYQYNDFNWLVNAEKTYNSSGETIETKIKYPHDYQTIEPYKTMVSDNILSPVIEQSGYKDNQFLQKTMTEYKNWGNNLFAPELLKQQNLNQSNPEPRITYHNYDTHGNPQYVSKDNADKVVYLWGYNYQYPVAQIENVTFEQVKTALGSQWQTIVNRITVAHTLSVSDSTLINSLRTNANLKEAFITTYTYKPLVGILSSKDPRGMETKYDYDAFGRLIKKSYDGKTVEEYNYNYKQ
jgi:YD repeat-containing protein